VTGSLKQVFPKSSVQSVFEKHRQAVLFLKGRGIQCKRVSSQTFEKDFRASILRMRKSFLASPLMFTVTVLWRAITKKAPYLGAIQTQPGVSQQIQDVIKSGVH
jgi:hypothetical protein